ncbi:hypothetical protein [Corallococcus carmarthensis]|uniref:TolC family protein n=1 Tax=Corallococcus carmarthensis TaxID=2316728 RepID=A0A3A8JNB0_9BACT|nr:hypothetical protein [Corallococcus carmarthensis]RKG97139.1 hypothetical protein D7X32_33785 [Corallococcus carmarthensis]
MRVPRRVLLSLCLCLGTPGALAQEVPVRLRAASGERARQAAQVGLRLRENEEAARIEEAAREDVARLLSRGMENPGPETAQDVPPLPDRDRRRLEQELVTLDARVSARAAQRARWLLAAGLEVDPVLRRLPGEPPEPWLADVTLDADALLARVHDASRRELVRAYVREHAGLQARLATLEALVTVQGEALARARGGLVEGLAPLEDVLALQRANLSLKLEVLALRVRREQGVRELAALLECTPESVVVAGTR